MHINEIFIKKYGKFEDFTLPLNGGFNLIYGENEAGKTTLNSFVRRMAYGMPSRDRSGVKTNDRLRYAPIFGGDMQGSLTLELENGDKVLVARTFGKTASGDKISILNDTTGEEVPRFRDGENLGEILFGCSDSMFEKTLWFKQNGTYMGGADDEITRRLINLAVSGDEDISTKSANEKLIAIQKSLKASDNRGVPGKIDKLQRELNELTDERLRLERKAEQIDVAEKTYTALIIERTNIEKHIAKYQELQKSIEVKQKFEIVQKVNAYLAEIDQLQQSENFVRFANFDEAKKNEINEKNAKVEELVKTASYDESEKDNAELVVMNKKKHIRTFASIFSVLLAVAGGAGYVMTFDWLFLLFSAFCVVGGMVLSYDRWRIVGIIIEIKKKIDEANQTELDKNEKITLLKREIDKIYTQLNVASYNELLERTVNANNIVTKIELLRENILVLLDGADFTELKREVAKTEMSSDVLDMNKTRIDESLNNGQAKLLQISEKIQDAKRNVNMLASDEQTLAGVITNIAKCEEELEVSKFELEAVKLAIETLNISVDEMKNNFTPKLNTAANEVIEEVTNGKYSDLRISEDLNIRVLHDGVPIEGEILSAGAFDQIYFALRMGIIKLLAGEHKILFLDDSFTQYDGVRAKSAFEYILKLSKECQVIMFTCQSRELELAKKYSHVNVTRI